VVAEPSWSATAPSGVKFAGIKDQAHRVQLEEIRIQGWCRGGRCELVHVMMAGGQWMGDRQGRNESIGKKTPSGKNVFLHTSSVHHAGILSCLPMSVKMAQM